MRRWHIVIFSAVMELAACVPLPTTETGAPQRSAPNPAFPARVAVLPVSNQAGSTDGAIILRAFAIRKLQKDLGYQVQKPEETDATIRDRTLSGPEVPVQVAMAKLDQGTLAAWLGVDGLLHGELQAYNRAKLSLYVRSQVKAHFWLTDASGKTIWESTKDSDSGGIGSGTASLDAILSDSQIPQDIIDRIHGSDLAPVAFDTVDEAFATFPPRN